MAVYITSPFLRAPIPEPQMYPNSIPPPSHGQILEYDRLYREYMGRRCINPQYYYVYPGDRIFRPSMLGFGDHAKVTPVDIVSYDHQFTLAHPTWIDDRWNRFEDPATVIIHASGSFSMSSSSASSAICSSSQGTHAYSTINTRTNSSWGVYHGPGSTHNRSGTIPTFLPQSKPHADLYAAGMALEHFRNFILPCMPPSEMMRRNAIIVTDSAYLLSCLTQNIEAWRLNGYKNAKKKVVSNAQTIRWLEDLVENLEKNYVSVVFWKVEKKENPDAVSMGKRALGEQEFWNVETQVPLNTPIPV